MTSTTDTAQHPEVSEISDLTEGLLPPTRAEEIRDHLAECELCAEIRDSLEEVRGLLGALPEPEPMPDDIAARIDAALAAEARTADTPADASRAAAVSHEDDVSRETEGAETGVSRETEGAETGGPSPLTLRTGSSPARPAGHPQASTGPGRSRARRRRRAVFLGAACGAAIIGMSVFFLQNLSSSSNSGATADQAVSASESGAHAYSRDTLETKVQDLLAGGVGAEDFTGQKRSPSADEQMEPEAESPGTKASKSPLLAPAVVVPPCVQQATGRTTPALALDEGMYQGTDAFLVVLPHPSDPARVQAYVIASSCVDTDPGSTGRLLLTEAYDRP
ncbi:anti-sigma factor family protein [Streptomyces sp. NPDC101178]|uniref:anti-sigma factor family protein n=1 Tax=Streptomyces sp. NPDC101178 TaxID=3366124 RepID=UPI0037FB3F0B